MAKDIAKLRALGPDELAAEEKSLREEIWKLRLQRTTGQLSDPHKVKKTRKDLARVLTVRRESQRAAEGRS